MTEEDTFKLLRRMPWNQLLEEVGEQACVMYGQWTDKEWEPWFVDRGWTLKEYRVFGDHHGFRRI